MLGSSYPLRRGRDRRRFASSSPANSSWTGSHASFLPSSRQILTRWQITDNRWPTSTEATGFSRVRMQWTQLRICSWATLAYSDLSAGGGAHADQVFRVGGQLVAVDLDFALVADENGPQPRPLARRQFQLEQNAVGIAERDAAGGAPFFRPDLARVGGVGSERPLDLIEGVRAPTRYAPAESAAVVVAKASPIAQPRMQGRAKRDQLRLMAPHVPIHLRRHGLDGQRFAALRPDEIRADYGVDPSEGAAPHQIAAEVVDGDGPLLGSHLDNAAVLLLCPNELPALFNRQRQGFLGINVQPRLHGMDADERPCVRCRGDKDGIELLFGEHGTIVLVLGDLLGKDFVARSAHRRSIGRHLPAIAVRQRNQAQIGRRLDRQIARAPGADQADSNSIIRPGHAWGGKHTPRNEVRQGNRGSGCLKKIASMMDVRRQGSWVHGEVSQWFWRVTTLILASQTGKLNSLSFPAEPVVA